MRERTARRCRPHGRPGGRGPQDAGHGPVSAGHQDRAVAGRAQRALLDAGQAPRERRDGAVHPVSGADVRDHQTVDRYREPDAHVTDARPDQDRRGPVAARDAKGTFYARALACVRV